MKFKTKFILLGMLVFTFFGCFNFEIPTIGDIVGPKVTAGPYEFYLTTYTVNFDTLLTYVGEDSLLDFESFREPYPIDPESDWFVLRDTFATDFDLDMSMGIEPIDQSVSYEIEIPIIHSIIFNVAAPISLGEIINVVAVPDGTPVPIDSVVIPSSTFYATIPMDELDFVSGDLSITITNQFGVDLGVPLEVTFFDSATGNVINDQFGNPLSMTWNTPIASGTSDTKSIDLAGVTFYKGLKVVVDGVINSNGPDTLLVSDAMKAASFDVAGAITNILVDRVSGDIEAFSYEDSATVDLGTDLGYNDITLEKAYLDPCNISIQITNTSHATSKLVIEFPRIDTDSSTPSIDGFTTGDMNVPSNGSQTYNFSLPAAAIDLSEDFKYIYSVNSSAQNTIVENGDSIAIEFTLYGENSGDSLFVSKVAASFDNTRIPLDPMEIEGISFDMLPEQFSGIELEALDLSMDFSIDMDIPATLNIKLSGVKNGGADSVNIDINQQITGAGGNSSITVPNAEDLINFKPDNIYFSGNITLDGSGDMNLEQTIAIEGALGIPFQFTIVEPIEFTPEYMRLKLEELPDLVEDFSGSISADVSNGFQFGVEFGIFAARDTNYFNSPAFADSIRTVVDLDLTALDSSSLDITLDKELYDFFAESEDSVWVKMNIALKGRDDGEATTFLSTDSVSVSVILRAEGTLDLSTVLDSTGGAQ